MLLKSNTSNPLLATLVASFFLSLAVLPLNAANDFTKQKTIVAIDGEESEVYFNDGDTFKILSERQSARIAGFNTLENYGPVHQWMGMSSYELYDLAQEATKEARNGTWNCETLDGEDSYGRLLVECDDLAVHLIEMGLAHAYSIDEKPAKKEYLKAQAYAQLNHQGIWAKGVPNYIVTSLHSAHEPGSSHYNRLISTKDGHTKKWAHNDVYGDCDLVCFEEDSCMLYVAFKHRYGKYRAECLYIEDLSDATFGEK